MGAFRRRRGIGRSNRQCNGRPEREEHDPGERAGRLFSTALIQPGGPYSRGACRPLRRRRQRCRGKTRKFSANITVGGSAKGGIKYTSYRYQTWSENSLNLNQPLVITQDTVIKYRQILLDAKAEAGIGEHSRSAEASYAYNMMTYKSAVAFWLYASGGAHVSGETGTGISFGVSVQFSRLLKHGASVNVTSPFIQSLAYKLCVPPHRLVEFIQQAAFIRENWDFPTGTILLESAWAAPHGYAIPMDGGKISDDMLKNMRAAANLDLHKSTWESQLHASPWTLQSLTARYRIADLLEDSRDLFKLGVSVVVSLDINLQKVEKAGVNGIVDIDTYWFDPDLKSTPNILDAYLKAVPRVALFHQ